ncbi:hypothetical protein BIFADO_02340 [Bifidobacterium adolescentis L2-32]|uniref:Uncharacterized protein n=1 Tax=Bifidobacterium adolescentis L2-32 TaxID=411481 RepID=A7A8Z7_BIFAD|nr:hypothetical protein BIFADO_02340 [Bifidobacterium adolescentis L2-32]
MFFVFQSTLSVRRATVPFIHFASSFIFQSTLSVRRATLHTLQFTTGKDISIHALRKESDVLNHGG